MASSPLKISSGKYRIFLLTSATVAVTSMAIALAASLVALHAIAHADELPYRLAADAFTKLAAVASALGLISLCAFLAALRLAFRQIAAAARELANPPG